MKDSKQLSAISLYSGAGGLDRGFDQANFSIEWAIDNDPWAVRSYNENLPPVAICGDVLAVSPPTGVNADVVIGGPPCQGFSVMGRMDPCDPRSQHVEHFLDVVEEVRPRAFVMENVKALAVNSRWASVREGLRSRAEGLGFETDLFVLDASHFGVAQARERMFLIGIQGTKPLRPEPSSEEVPPTVRDVLSALPRVGKPGNDGICTARVVPARNPVMRPTAHAGSLLFNGSGRPLKLDSPAKTITASMGGNATPIIDQDELEYGADAWVTEYHERLLRGGKPRRRAPKRLRRITIQEVAALQSFPPEWRFLGPQVAQYRQIGNAVPPMLAKAVAECLRIGLETARSSTTEVEPVAA